MAQAQDRAAPAADHSAKPAPLLQPLQPGRAQMLRDLAWLLGRLARVAPRPFVLWIAAGLAQGLIVPAQLWLTKALVDALAAQLRTGRARDTLPWLGLLVASLLAERAVGGLLPWLAATVREAVSAALQEQVMWKAATIDLAAFEHEGYYNQLNQVMGDVETRAPQLLQQVLQGVQTLPRFLGYAVALGTLSPLLPPIVLAAVIPTVVGFARTGQSNWQLLSQQTRDRRLAGYYALLLSDRTFAKEVRLYGLSGYLRTRWAALFWQTRDAQRRLALRQGMRQRGMVLATTAVSMLGLWWVVAAHLLRATAGGYALLFQSLQGLIGATFTLSGTLQSYGEQSGYASAFRAFLRQPGEGAMRRGGDEATRGTAERRDGCNTGMQAILERSAIAPGSPPRLIAPSRHRPLPRPLRQGIAFEDVWFTYPGIDRPALAGVSFQIGVGEKVALVGENGAGKTTLTKLLLGLYRPDQGRITVGGFDVRDIDQTSLRAAMSAVFQQFTRYQLTLVENVAIAAPDRMDHRQAIVRAAEQAGADDVARGLPGGYDTLLGPDVGGVDLSGGQWQRVALARAFFREADILVLDEPTAALDPLAELALFGRFATLAEGKTALLISHRLGMARLADRVMVLSGGRLVEMGTHETLLQAQGEYTRLFEAQARWYR